MKMEIELHGSLRRRFRRVGHHYIKRALAGLGELTQPEAIHAVRKEIKKLRSILRLCRESKGPREYQKMSKAMRRATKPLAAPGDASVTKMALEKLGGSNLFPEIRSALTEYSYRVERRYRENDTATATGYLLGRLHKSITRSKIHRSGWREFRLCLRRSYARGRRAYQSALRHPPADNLHQWRKEVKTLREQLTFTCPAWPQRTRDMIHQLKYLGNRLGVDHDLALLKNFAKQLRARCQESAKLIRLVNASRKKLGEEIFQLGSILYQRPAGELFVQWKQDSKTWGQDR